MIGKLRKKLVLAAMASLLAVLLVIMGGVALLYYQKILTDADATLTVLAQNGGFFPESMEQPPQRPRDKDAAPPVRPGVSPNCPLKPGTFLLP